MVVLIGTSGYFFTAQSAKKTIFGLVIPHHDIVASQRKEFLQEAAKYVQPKTIILVSPNHYDVGKSVIQTVDQNWNLSTGNIGSRSDVIQGLIKNGVGNEPSSFPDEHGIHLVLADIHNAFPKANLVPLIIKSTATREDIFSLIETLVKTCADCLMIASVDFSHYQPALLADLHDQLTIRGMEQLDEESLLTKAEVDSPAALVLLAKWAERASTKKLVVRNHTNSGEMLGNKDIPTTSHVFAWYEAGKAVLPKSQVTFLFGGDIMLGRMIGHTFLGQGMRNGQAGLSHVFDRVGERLFWGVDAGTINLEGPISRRQVLDDYKSKNLIFNLPPQSISALKFLRINAVSLANNHTANQGREGLAVTRDLLKKADIRSIGGPGNLDVPNVGIFEGSGMKLIVIGVHTLYGSPDISDLIAGYKKDPKNRVLIFPHWGTEYKRTHNVYQEEMAHQWIDAGADIVVGSHPHVIQDMQVYKNKPIIYSLGNFVFDQNFSKETQQGLLVGGEFDENGLRLFGLPVQSIKYQPSLMIGVAKQAILQELYKPLEKYVQHTSLGDQLYFPL